MGAKITKGTIVRTIMLLIVVINMILKNTGKQPIEIAESDVYSTIEMVVSVAIILLSWWKNNSFTKNAQLADEYLQELKKFDEEE